MVLYLFTDKDCQTILALKNGLFRVKYWQCRLCTSGSLPFHLLIDSVTIQSGAHLLARGSEIILRRCRLNVITHTKVSHRISLFLSLQRSNNNALLEGKRCCHITMLSKCENTTYINLILIATRKPAIAYYVCHMYGREMKLWCMFEALALITRYSRIYHLNGT